jgi:hypothetical protein
MAHTSAMAEKRASGWLISLQAPTIAGIKLYAVVADNLEQAKALVGDHLKVTNERVELERVLTEAEVERLRLSPRQVRTYETS